MFTSKEIRTIGFEEVKRGYNMTDVKAFLQKISEQVAEYEQQRERYDAERESYAAEKAALENKLQILADKIEQYRSEEDSLRAALLSAQKLGDNIVNEAKENSAILLNDARIKADDIVNEARGKIAGEQGKLEQLQREVAKFKNEVLGIYKSHLEVLSLIPETNSEVETPVAIPEPVVPSVLTSDVIPDVPSAISPAMPEMVVNSQESVVVTPDAVIEAATVEIPAQREFSPEIQPTNTEPDNQFFAPKSPENDNNPFVGFEMMPAVEAEEAPVAAETQQQAAPASPSRFGQLDFGDGFSFNAK